MKKLPTKRKTIKEKNKNEIVILGIDPGTATTGWGIIKNSGARIGLVDYNCIRTRAGLEMPKRLRRLFLELKKTIREYQPDVLVLEKLFFNTNVKTAMSVGQARGVVMLAAQQSKIDLVEYTALQAKLELTGYGRSDKKTMQKTVQKELKLKKKIKSDDAADALALAICYVKKNHNKSMAKSKRDKTSKNDQ